MTTVRLIFVQYFQSFDVYKLPLLARMSNHQQMNARDVEARNVSGSTAGASSGDFHVYRRQRRNELERLEKLEKDSKDRQILESHMKAIQQLKARDEQKTAKRAAKRRKKKGMQILARNNREATKRRIEPPNANDSQQLVRDNRPETQRQPAKQLFSPQSENELKNLAALGKTVEDGHDGGTTNASLGIVGWDGAPIEVCSNSSGSRNEENPANSAVDPQ